ncbi:MAG: CHAT domain-containing protein [Nannocystis sp.]|uniref:CHAT domain-containing protein n=1 Tax=Nannocystis sp. TaxID=1962667 RepID=UPI002426F003|nr:CHAT domain-containing protein [Nannocystis sp.]MBK9756541.1 CHAT domain-containing protein [Nannocystis sp.]
MSEPLHIVLEFARAESAGQPHSFRFAAQPYLVRTPGGGFEASEFPWSRALLADLQALRDPAAEPELLHRIGGLLREFLAGVGWGAREEAIVAAARAGAAIAITIRSAAAELYALPWELVALKSTGQLLGGIPGLVIRYEWPETSSFPDPVTPARRRGRVLFAWSAAGGAVPAAEHQAALQAALAADFDPARDVVPHASFAAIAAALERAGGVDPPIDALLLLCHGAAIGGAYGLALDATAGAAEANASVVVDAGRVQQLIAPHAGALRLVVLAACNSGADGEPGNHLGSIAQMIHRAGLRAVVASRFPLSTAGSSRFCGALFAALAGPGTSLERAFVVARDALVRDPGQLDWASVQLYARAADGDATYPLTRSAGPVVAAAASPLRRWPWRWLGLGLVAAAAIAGLVLAWDRGEAPSEVAVVAPEPSTPAPERPVVVPEPTTLPVTHPPTPTPTPTPIMPTPITPTPVTPTTRKPVVEPRPTTPATKPVLSGACPGEIQRYLENALPAPAAGGVRPDLRVRVAADGGLSYEVLGASKGYASEAAAARPTLSARLTKELAGALPCTLKLLSRP